MSATSNQIPEAPRSVPQMPLGTRNFLQKLCRKETASVDMTRHGFVHDSHPLRLFLNPLRTQIQKIHGRAENIERTPTRVMPAGAAIETPQIPIIYKYIEEKKSKRKSKKCKLKLKGNEMSV